MQPLFAGDPPHVGELVREDQRRNRPEALAAALRGVGAGEMRPLWRRLGELAMPAAVLVGDRDRKYHALGRRMVRLLPHAQLLLLAGGHRLPLENPAAVARALERVHPEARRRGDGDPSPARGQLVLDAREQPQRRQPAVGEGTLGRERGRRV